MKKKKRIEGDGGRRCDHKLYCDDDIRSVMFFSILLYFCRLYQ